MPGEDDIYSRKMTRLVDFEFDEKVASVFPDMIERSVPGYCSLIALLGGVLGSYVHANSRIYDLGCSLGAASLSILNRMDQSLAADFILVDQSEAMLQKCRANLESLAGNSRLDFRCEDIRHSDLSLANIVILNFTLQFIDKADRQVMIDRIYKELQPEGVLLLSEKVIFSDNEETEIMQALHYQFKRANGYSDLEISQKRTALEKVLIPETVESHIDRLHKAGFKKVYQWFQSLNFVSLLAIK